MSQFPISCLTFGVMFYLYRFSSCFKKQQHWSYWEPVSHLIMCCASGVNLFVVKSCSTELQWGHFCGLLETNFSVVSCTLSSCAECLTVAVSLMSERSVHFHPRLPLVRMMIDSVSGPRWLTSLTHPPTLPLTLSTRLLLPLPFIPSVSLAQLSPPLPVYISLTSSTVLWLFAPKSYSLCSFPPCHMSPSSPSPVDSSGASRKVFIFVCVIGLKYVSLFIFI